VPARDHGACCDGPRINLSPPYSPAIRARPHEFAEPSSSVAGSIECLRREALVVVIVVGARCRRPPSESLLRASERPLGGLQAPGHRCRHKRDSRAEFHEGCHRSAIRRHSGTGACGAFLEASPVAWLGDVQVSMLHRRSTQGPGPSPLARPPGPCMSHPIRTSGLLHVGSCFTPHPAFEPARATSHRPAARGRSRHPGTAAKLSRQEGWGLDAGAPQFGAASVPNPWDAVCRELAVGGMMRA
jgi:hypothetical protein